LRLVAADHFATPDQLARFDHEQRVMASLHRPNLVPCYEAGEWEGGRFVATRFVRGRTLAELHKDRATPAPGALAPLADALRAAHAAGLVHGRISERNILIEADGTPYLADLGLGRGGTPDADALALAAVAAELPARARPPGASKTRRALLFGLAALVSVATVAALALNVGDEAGRALGKLGCTEHPSPNTAGCTLAQTRRDGSPVTVRRAGVIRGWSVRGASGELALQVIRVHGERSFAAAFSQPQELADAAPRRFDSEIAVERGDRIGLRLGPGATVGARSGSRGSAVARWNGGLTSTPQAIDVTTPGQELMLRVEIDPGADPEGPRELFGNRAAAAPAGRPLAETPVALSEGRPARAVVVELPEGIAVDLFRGRRLARLAVPDADPRGELLEFTQNCGPAGARGFCLRWRDPDSQLVLEHAYRVRASGRIELIG
jgi:hypothetical protein